jgi:iron complex outermembrane receptor protein
MRSRYLLLAAASAGALLHMPALALAQDQAAPAAEKTEVEELVVTGTRTPGRTRLDTIAPVDVIGAQALARQGNGAELAQALANLTPAIDFPRPAITDGTDHVRPATLRGLAPDQTLVLINGMRGHIGALVNINGSIGRGSTAFDLNTIPTVAVDRVEVLRDGASAQYGADAIAGVINLRLREARSGGGVTLNYGIYDTSYKTARGKHDANDGLTQSVSAWQGLPLGADGFLTVSGEYLMRHPTNRSDYVDLTPAPAYGRKVVLGRYGDPKLESGAVYLNAALPVNETWTLYSYGGYQRRDSESAATARTYNNSNNVPAVYPGGFLPIIATKIDDYNIAGGVRGELAGFKTDLGVTYGKNKLEYTIKNSINSSYGAASPRNFKAGGLDYDQFLVNLNMSKGFDLGLIEPTNLGFGLEYRKEGFSVHEGEPASYSKGPLAGAPVSQGFGGFRPSNVVDKSRHNVSAYVDLEGKLTERLSFDAAGRYEDYSDFGSKVTGKLAARFDVDEALAIRGAISSGVKSPALQQQYFSYTATNNVATPTGSILVESGTFTVDSPIAVALGAKPLKPEKSMNYSAGIVFHTGPFELTIDAYQIDIDDRIVLSENLPNPSTPAATAAVINALLAPYGVSAARFFLNGVKTRTRGVDMVGRYRLETETAGRFDLTLAANFNGTDVLKTPGLPTITSVSQPPFLFDRGNVLTYEQGTPNQKFVFNTDWSLGDFGVTAKATYYDSVLVPNNNPTLDYETGHRTIVDLEGRYKLGQAGLALGVNNLFDQYPRETPALINTPSGSIGFPSYSPFGFNGRFLYARVSYNW